MIELRLPISPTPAFLNRVRLIAASVRQWEPDATPVISCYPSPDDPLVSVGWSCPTDAEFASWSGTRSPYMSTIADTWRGPFTGDHILHLDADVFPVAPFPGLLNINALCGVQAHHSPYGVEGWRQLFGLYGLPPPLLTTEYSGWNVMFTDRTQRYGPRGYFNSGFVFGPRALFERLAPAYAEAVVFLRATLSDTYWIDQVAFTLAVHQAGIPTHQLSLRWNFPNRPSFDAAHPAELADVRFLHAMQTDIVDRDGDFESADAMAALVARTDLTGSNERLRRHVQLCWQRMD
jgi:hypothetical protein